jgi:tetratricopeptide (TPR) repeat protein
MPPPADPLDEIALRFEIRWAEAHARARPEDLDALRMLAYAYSAAGRHEEALVEDRRLVERAPERADLHYDLACSLALLGRRDEAFASLGRALDLGFDDGDCLDSDDDLVSLRKDPRWAPLRGRLPE